MKKQTFFSIKSIRSDLKQVTGAQTRTCDLYWSTCVFARQLWLPCYVSEMEITSEPLSKKQQVKDQF